MATAFIRFKRLLQRSRRRSTGRSRVAGEFLETRILPATIVVNSLSDVSGDDTSITLREAIVAANTDSTVNGFSGSFTGSGADTITFAPVLSGSIVLLNGPLEINSEISIEGLQTERLVLDGNGLDRVLSVAAGGGVATIRHLEIRNGFANDGGGISNDGTLTVVDSIVTGNRTPDTGATGAAGIQNEGTLTVVNSQVDHNVVGDLFSNISVGGIHNEGLLFVENSAVFQNESPSGFGGIYNTGTANVDGSSVYGNNGAEGGGVSNEYGTLSVANSTIAINGGAGVFVRGDSTAGMTQIHSSTIIANSGGVEVLALAPLVELNNSVVALNNGGAHDDIEAGGGAGVSATSSNNFVGIDDVTGVSGFTGFVDGERGNQVGTQAAPLNPLLDGGHTFARLLHYAPQTGSPLIDAGQTLLAVDSAGNAADFDQPGTPRVFGSAVDIGAIEINSELTISFDGSRHVIQLQGTPSNDAFVAVPTEESTRLTINQTNYKLNSVQFVNPLYEIDAAGGTDQLRLHLDGAEAEFRPLELDVTQEQFELQAVDFEHIRIVDTETGAAGDAIMYGSSGDDVFVANDDIVWLYGPGYSNVIQGAGDVVVGALAGSNQALINIQATETSRVERHADGLKSVRVNGSGRLQLSLNDIDDATVWVNPAAEAEARLRGSAGNDVLESGPLYASLTSSDTTFAVHGATRVVAVGGLGRDTALIQDSAGDDNFTIYYGSGEYGTRGQISSLNARMQYNGGYVTEIEEFAIAIATSTSGNDSVEIYDSPGDDIVVATTGHVVMRRTNFATSDEEYYVQANGFSNRRLIAGAGSGTSSLAGWPGDHDRLQIFDSLGTNHLTVQPDRLTLDDTDGTVGAISTQTTEAIGFQHVTAVGNNDSQNTLEWASPLEYTLVRIGNWVVN